MRDLPDIETLLALAADDGDGALVARCRAIAARERAAGIEPYDVIDKELRALCDRDEGEPLATLAAAIRRGRFDDKGSERDRLVHLLWHLALQKLRENNPGFELK
jgi:Domain of unknown function (DUF6285)